MSVLKARSLPSREKRLDTLSAFYGEASELIRLYSGEEIDQRIRTFSQSAPDDLYSVLDTLIGVRDAGIIVHGPRGCAATLISETLNKRFGFSNRWLVTNLNQRETILGADSKLRAAITSFNRLHHPKILFVVSSPSVAINNDDIASVIDELSEELGLVIAPIFSSGFSSKSGVHGYDLATYSLAKHLFFAAKEKIANQVNLISVGENYHDVIEANRLLDSLGLSTVTFPDIASFEQIQNSVSSSASAPLNFDRAHFLGRYLEDSYGIPYLSLPRPIGWQATKRWLVGVAAAFGKEAAAKDLHAKESLIRSELLQNPPFAGKSVYVSLDPATAFGILPLIQELGGNVAGLSVSHVDRLHVEALKEFQDKSHALTIHVGDTQSFEEINILQRIKPDLYIGNAENITQAARLGIPSLYLPGIPILGYNGIGSFAKAAANALRNTSYLDQIQLSDPVYSKSWIGRSPNWHIKQEVR